MNKSEITNIIVGNVYENHQGLITGASLQYTLIKMLEFIESNGGTGGGGDNPPVTRTYTFSVTAGTNGSVVIQGYGGTTLTVNAGTTLTIKATANSGYRFKQWSDGNTNSTRSVTVNSDMSLSATFEVVSVPTYTKTFTVKFMSGNSVFKTVTESVSYTTQVPVTTNITIPAEVPTKPNYTFSGWYKNAAFTGDRYTANTSVVVSDGDKFYAKFEESATQLTKTFHVTFDYNYTGGGSTTGTYEKTYMSNESEPQTMTITLPTPAPTRSGHTFKGWSLSRTATSGTVSGNFTIHDNDTLYAVWQENAPVGYTIYDLFSDAVPYTSENINELSGLLVEHTGITSTYTTPTQTSYSYYFAIPAGKTVVGLEMISQGQSSDSTRFVNLIGQITKNGNAYDVYLHDSTRKISRKYILSIGN